MNTSTFTRNIAAADQFIDWLVASVRLSDLRWQDDESGMWFQRAPSDEIFDNAYGELADAWSDLKWYEQKYVISAAADQLAEIEALSNEASALIRGRI
jgi:hypothetical protein